MVGKAEMGPGSPSADVIEHIRFDGYLRNSNVSNLMGFRAESMVRRKWSHVQGVAKMTAVRQTV